jgi:hypothetical protein
MADFYNTIRISSHNFNMILQSKYSASLNWNYKDNLADGVHQSQILGDEAILRMHRLLDYSNVRF